LNCASSSPLGFSELFNEFRLHENLHSLDDILYAIIDADGMSFNDLKPIYKEFLLKLAVTLTQDELFQRSKNIMRRQKKKKQKRKASVNGSQVALAISNGAAAPEENEALITPFHNIAVWSAVKFVISDDDGGAAFLPLITDPENIDKTALFQPLR